MSARSGGFNAGPRRQARPFRRRAWPLVVILVGGLLAAVWRAEGSQSTAPPSRAVAFEPGSPGGETAAAPPVAPTEAPRSPTPAPPTTTPLPTPTPDPTPTLEPTPTFTPTPLPPTPTPLPPHVLLEGIRHEYQGWNNCGPVTIGMALNFYGRQETQEVIAPILKPNPDDKNVSPEEMAAYAESLGFEVHVGVAGTLELLKALLAAGYPVIAETWLEPEPDNGMGHYRLLIGYDEQERAFIAHDSLYGPFITLPYDEFDRLWQVFNRTYVVVYPPERREPVETILGFRLDEARLWAHALDVARAEVEAEPDNAFAWFNLGSSLLRTGNAADAAQAFDRARAIGWPWRMLWYQFGPMEAYFAVGRYEDVIALTTANLEQADVLEESYYWRGRARAALGDVEGAHADYRRALELNPNSPLAPEIRGRLATDA